MSTLWFMNYNNYANRIVKKESSLSAYGTAGRNVFNKPNIDFNPNDGVTTTLIVDAPAGHNPDYMLVVDKINNVDTITSRWFVIEWTRTRGGQYRASLKRDALIDNLDTIASSPILVQKGTVNNLDDICIYQKENIEYNQIKKKEVLLKDQTGVGWIIGFATSFQFVNAELHQTLQTDYNVEYNQSYNGINTYPYYQYRDGQTPYFCCNKINSELRVTRRISLTNFIEWTFTHKSYGIRYTNLASNATFTNIPSNVRQFSEMFISSQKEIERIILNNESSIETSNSIVEENGQIIRDTSTTPNTYYRVEVIENDKTKDITITKGSETEELVCDYLHNQDNNLAYTPENNFACLNCTLIGKSYNIKLIPIEVNTLSGVIPTAPRRLNDAPYYMFAIPYGQTYFYTSGRPANPESFGFNSCSKEIALNIARNLVDNIEDGEIQDIQLLPFCPVTNIFKEYEDIKYRTIEHLSPSIDYTLLKDSDNHNKAIIFFPSNSSFKGEIKLSEVTNTNINVPVDVEDFKIENETKKFRLTSPNFASMFEFKNTYNQKNIINFNYRCTYRPYNSFVNVYPKEIGGLYGNDYRDNFGLIFQGDFSIPLLKSSDWKTYQINNKNYQNSFNRSIDTFDLEAKWSQAQDIVGAVSGTVSGVAQGAMAGGVAGAIVGGVASAGAGVMDIVANEQMRQNKRGEMIDQFNFSLENVRARPRSIANVGTFDINNKIFPILEIFDCTDEEKEILRNKLRYTGYTINKIAYLRDYMGGYFKGVVIFNEDINEDSHVQEVINEELGKGVYTNGLSI